MDKYEIKENLGQGSFGTVYRVIHIKTGKEYAMKLVNLSKTNVSRDMVDKEIAILKKLSSPCKKNIICYKEHKEVIHRGSPHLMLVMQYIDGYDLLDLLEHYKEKGVLVAPNDLYQYMLSMYKALSVLHKNGVAHNDIKLENIMVDSENNKLVLIDFGLSCVYKGIMNTILNNKATCKKNELKGSLSYINPKIQFKHSHSKPITFADRKNNDVWALSLVFYELMAFDHPIERLLLNDREVFSTEVNQNEINKNIIFDENKLYPDNTELAKIVLKGLNINRIPSADTMVKHIEKIKSLTLN